jgi:hypothetical protein
MRAAPVVAELLARELGWLESRKQEALNQYLEKIRELMEKAGLAGTPVN